MRVSADTGLAARPGDPNAIFESFMAGHLPPEAADDGAPMDLDGDESGDEESEDSLF
jgi:hypothetical protein